MLLAYSPDVAWDPGAEPGLDVAGRGELVGSHELEPVSTATSVRVFEYETIVTDGPFADTRERLAGCHVVDAESLDEAIEIASRVPQARHGVVEIRPVASRGATG